MAPAVLRCLSQTELQRRRGHDQFAEIFGSQELTALIALTTSAGRHIDMPRETCYGIPGE